MDIIVLTGATAAGKTTRALQLAQKQNGELISCDARHIYRGCDIVTGKDIDTQTWRQTNTIGNFQIGYALQDNIPVWLLDITAPDVLFSSFDFETCAVPVIRDIVNRGKTPIIVGGSYFYLKHLLYTIPTSSIKPDWDLRSKLGIAPVSQLQRMLEALAPDVFKNLNNSDRNNPHRLIRKIEIAQSGKNMPAPVDTYMITLGKKIGAENIQVKFSGIEPDPPAIRKQKITERVQLRLAKGAVEETKHLIDKYGKRAPAIAHTIGYPQIMQYLDNKISADEMAKDWITKELQYSKRQITFMKKDPNISWLQ